METRTRSTLAPALNGEWKGLERGHPCKHLLCTCPVRCRALPLLSDPVAASLVQALFLQGSWRPAVLLSSLCCTQQPARPLALQPKNLPISLVQPTPLWPPEESLTPLTLPSPFSTTPAPMTILYLCTCCALARNASPSHSPRHTPFP